MSPAFVYTKLHCRVYSVVDFDKRETTIRMKVISQDQTYDILMDSEGLNDFSFTASQNAL